MPITATTQNIEANKERIACGKGLSLLLICLINNTQTLQWDSQTL